MKTYIISDLHFNHKNIIRIDNRPFEDIGQMNDRIINNWNKVVQSDDTVIIAGDFCFGGINDWKYFLNKLKGKKILVLGNHDNEKKIPKECFVQITHILKYKYKEVYFNICHYPIMSWDGMFHNTIHCFGHIHAGKNDFENLTLPNSFNVGCMLHNYTPICLDEIINKQLNFIDECKKRGLL